MLKQAVRLFFFYAIGRETSLPTKPPTPPSEFESHCGEIVNDFIRSDFLIFLPSSVIHFDPCDYPNKKVIIKTKIAMPAQIRMVNYAVSIGYFFHYS